MLQIAPKRPAGRPAKYPWKQMQVGESFFAPGRTPRSICNDARLHYQPMRFTTRTVVVNGTVGVRVWRIA